MDELSVVEIAERVDKLIDEKLGLWDCEPFSPFYHIEHILGKRKSTPLVQISKSI